MQKRIQQILDKKKRLKNLKELKNLLKERFLKTKKKS